MMDNLQEIYNYTFHFNYHLQVWTAIPRGMEQEYWNGMTSPGMLRSKDISTLIEIVMKLERDPNFMDKIERS